MLYDVIKMENERTQAVYSGNSSTLRNTSQVTLTLLNFTVALHCGVFYGEQARNSDGHNKHFENECVERRTRKLISL